MGGKETLAFQAKFGPPPMNFEWRSRRHHTRTAFGRIPNGPEQLLERGSLAKKSAGGAAVRETHAFS